LDYTNLVLGVAAIGFAAISSPDPTLFVISHAGPGDRRGSTLVGAGVLAATITCSTLAACWLGKALSTIPGLPDVIRIRGAYLVWFGYKRLRLAWSISE
jgi:threonine/homoserine/homoserine lactone efflux protein